VPDRTGSALRWPFQPRSGLESSTSDAPCRLLAQPARVRSNQKARIASTTPSSKDAAFTLRSAFHRQVPLVPRLRRIRRSPPPFLEVLPPASRLPAIPSPSLNLRQVPACAAPLRWLLESCTAWVPKLIAPDGRQIRLYRLSTSAISTVLEHDCGLDHHPASLAGGCPPTLLSMQAALRLSTRCRSSCPWFRGRRSLFSADGTSRAEARELCPDHDQPGHLMSQTHVHAGRRSRRDWDSVPTSLPADSARPSAPGLHCPTFREEGRALRTRGAFHQGAAPKGWLADSTSCHQPVE
jgi:hypothetical protein